MTKQSSCPRFWIHTNFKFFWNALKQMNISSTKEPLQGDTGWWKASWWTYACSLAGRHMPNTECHSCRYHGIVLPFSQRHKGWKGSRCGNHAEIVEIHINHQYSHLGLCSITWRSDRWSWKIPQSASIMIAIFLKQNLNFCNPVSTCTCAYTHMPAHKHLHTTNWFCLPATLYHIYRLIISVVWCYKSWPKWWSYITIWLVHTMYDK